MDCRMEAATIKRTIERRKALWMTCSSMRPVWTARISKVKVLPTHDASKVRASGSGLKTTGVPSSLPVKFNIDGKDAGPRREAQEANICDNHDGTYLVSYVPDMTDSCSVHPDSSPYATLNSNICQLCIQLEAFACCAEALGRDFRPLLTTWLYTVPEKAGEETLLVSQAALSSIWNINKVCGYASLKELINENSDYLLNDISLNLQRLSQHPQTESPFRMNIGAGCHPNKVKVSDPGVAKTGLKAFQPTYFTVDCSESGQGQRLFGFRLFQ
ncbi:unnamed protein product [Oreochromis niloticus]|nr:unnamed protein product [Mustela putorius furo]